MKPNILERALTGHKTNKYYIFKSFITSRWHVIHRGQVINLFGDPTDTAARRRAYYHHKGFIR